MAGATMIAESYDRAKAVKDFEDSKMGVKGLVDSGISIIPEIFVHPPETIADINLNNSTANNHPDPDLIPVIDLSGVNDSDLRSTIVDKVSRASREMGFFQIVNHGIEVEFLKSLIEAIKAFHEQPAEIKAPLYGRDEYRRYEHQRGVTLFSNIDIFHSKAATWRDTLQMKLSPDMPALEDIPEIFRNEVVEWNEKVSKLGEVLMELLSEGLGVEKGRLKELTFTDGKGMVGNYYPCCPQPERTMGIQAHTDPGALAILVQDNIGRLQFKYGEEWIEVKYVPGALVVNIGDLLQIMSNDEYKSVQHRLLANSCPEPRVTVVVFFGPSDMNRLYAPLPELCSSEHPLRFQSFTFEDYLYKFLNKELDGRSLINCYRISED